MTPAQVALRRVLCAAPFLFSILFVLAIGGEVYSQKSAAASRSSSASVPQNTLLRIVRAEDERRWDADLRGLLSDRNRAVRARAALAAGRIGDERAVPALVTVLQQDKDNTVRAMAAFALGETEAASAVEALIAELIPERRPAELNARIMEALGKIIAALPKVEGERARSAGEAIFGMLNYEYKYKVNPDRQLVLPGLTALLRARPEGAGKVIAQFLSSSDPRVRADAANALARLRAKDGNEQLRKLLTTDPDPIVRANAARVLGATEDKDAFEGLLDRALKDTDSRVRVSAIRSLAALKDQRAAEAFWVRATLMLLHPRSPHGEWNEIIEVAVMLGRVLPSTSNERALEWLGLVRERLNNSAPEVEIALVRISPQTYLAALGGGAAAIRKAQETMLLNWNAASSLAQGLGEVAALPDSTTDKAQLADQAQDILRAMLDYKNSGIIINTLVAVHSEYAIPDVLRAFAAFKPKDLGSLLIAHLKETDVVIRATAAELLGELPPDESNTSALIKALLLALTDKQNDAALSIIESLGKQKTAAANEAIKRALNSSDYLVRRHAAISLKANGQGDFSARIGTVKSRNVLADYQRAISRIGTTVQAIVSTTNGSFTIELLPGDAPLTVDNFVQLAKRGYFKGITVHRVVPNFVIQDGDPRGDGNGGPGYQIRCEINQVPYERGAVGMALSGKDTGGSQWFVTHSLQPHLDGGYTVFGRVVSGMEVVDSITRGNIIHDIVITETGRGRKAATRRRLPKSRV